MIHTKWQLILRYKQEKFSLNFRESAFFRMWNDFVFRIKCVGRTPAATKRKKEKKTKSFEKFKNLKSDRLLLRVVYSLCGEIRSHCFIVYMSLSLTRDVLQVKVDPVEM